METLRCPCAQRAPPAPRSRSQGTRCGSGGRESRGPEEGRVERSSGPDPVRAVVEGLTGGQPVKRSNERRVGPPASPRYYQ